MRNESFAGAMQSASVSVLSSLAAPLACFALGLVGFAVISIPPSNVLAVEFIEIVEDPVPMQDDDLQGIQLENFEQWVFNRQLSVAAAKKQLLGRLQAEADSIQSVCDLSDQQKKTLLLAGNGDLFAFFQQYDALRSRFADTLKQNNRDAFNNLWQEIQPLQTKYNGPLFGEGSLFIKVLDHILDEQQSARMEQLRREQREFQYRAAVMQMVSQLDQVAPLTQEQREQLLNLIDQHTTPPGGLTGGTQRQLLSYYVLWQMTNIPEDELRPLFNEAEWKVLQKLTLQGKSMRRNLERQGLVPEKKDET